MIGIEGDVRGRVPSRMAALLAGLVFGLPLAAPAGAQSITLEPAADATLYEESGDEANGAGASLFAGRTAGDDRRRALLRFDLGALPAGATVTSVELVLSVTRTIAGPVSMQLHRLQGAWSEGASVPAGNGGQGAPALPGDATWTWSTYPTLAWTAPGGDFVAAASASQDVGGTGTYAWSSAGLVADVQAWVDAPAGNHGWILLADETLAAPTARQFAAREHADPGLRPRLTVTWTQGGGPGPAPAAAPTTVPTLADGMLAMLAALLAAFALLSLRRR